MNFSPKMAFWIFILSLVYFNSDILFFVLEINRTLGDYYYPLDDTYIHLAISKNLAQHGVWGVSMHQFSNSSSSPFFTVILAMLIKIFGNHSQLPLYLNIMLSNTLLLLIYLFFRQKPWQMLLVYFGFLLGAILRIQVFSGMEHALQLLVIGVAWLSFCQWQASNFTATKLQYCFYTCALLSCISRYESMFFIAPIVLYLAYCKHHTKAILVAVLAFLPIVVFGFYSLNNGGHFFPNSLLMKGKHSFDIADLLGNFIINLKAIYALMLPCLGYGIYLLFRQDEKAKALLHSLVFINVISHLMFAGTGWLYRYDAYLIALLVISFTYLWSDIKIEQHWQHRAWHVGLMLSAMSLIVRERKADKFVPIANKNIHDQQVQMGRFVQQYYPKATVFGNDIGAMAYFGDVKLHDMVGLGSNDILDIMLKPNSDAALDNYVKNTNYDLMIIYDHWFPNANFGERYKVAQLSNIYNKVCASDKVSFYVRTPQQKIYAKKALQSFKKTLPKDITLEVLP